MRTIWLLMFGAGLLTVAIGCGTGSTKNEKALESKTDARSADDSEKFSGIDGDSGKHSRSDGEITLRNFHETHRKSESPPRKPSLVSKPKPQLQSGTLTAGSLDDHAKYDDFRQFFSTVLQQPGNRNLPRLSIGRRVEIAVRNDAGEPIGNARLVIRRADKGADESVVAEFPTGTDGRGVFLSGYDGGNGGAAFRVTATSHDGKRTVTQRFELEQSPWTMTLPNADAELPQRLDLALVLDTTGSMKDELEYLKVEIDGIARAIHKRYPNVDQRYALILYRDHGDQYVTRTFDFTGSIDEFRKSLSRQSANGGGDMPEAVHLALEQARQLSWRGGNTARVMFLIGDAPPHQRDEQQTLDSVRQFRKRGVTIFPVAASGAQKRTEFLFRMAAFVTRGQYLFLTDHSGVGNPHAKPHASKYNVERLDQLMIRMVASQLAGKKLLPRDIIANERTADGPGPAQRPRQDRSTLPPKHLATASDLSAVPDEESTFWPLSLRWTIAVFAIAGILLLERIVGVGRRQVG